MPIFVDNAGPFGGVAGVTKTIPAAACATSTRTSRRRMRTSTACRYRSEIGSGDDRQRRYTGSSGRKLYDLADPNKPGAALVYTGHRHRDLAAEPALHAFNTRGNRGQSQYHGVTFCLDLRQLAETGLQLSAKYTLSSAHDNLSTTFSDDGNNNFNLGYLDAFDPMLDWLAHSTSGTASRCPACGCCRSVGRQRRRPRRWLADWQLNWIFTARTGYPFTLFDCTNGFALCMRAENPDGHRPEGDRRASTGNPNEFSLLDLTPLLPHAGGYVNPITGNSDFGRIRPT